MRWCAEVDLLVLPPSDLENHVNQPTNNENRGECEK
jgi:hypothetical protein